MSWPWVHRSAWDRVKRLLYGIFHRQAVAELARTRQIIRYYALTISLFTLVIYIAYYFDLRAFSYTGPVFTRPSPGSVMGDLATLLTAGYYDAFRATTLNRLCLGALLAIALLTTTTSLSLSLRKLKWQPRFLLKRLGIFVVFQLVYILPLLALALIPELVVRALLKAASRDIHMGILALTHADPSTRLVTNPAGIVAALSDQNATPYLLAEGYPHEGLVSYFGVAPSDTFYRAVVLPTLIYDSNVPDFGHAAILFPNYHLLINPNIPQDDLATILTALSLKMFQLSELADRVNNHKPPVIRFLNENEYNTLENQKIRLERTKIEDYLAGLNREIVSLQNYLSQTKADLASVQKNKAAYLKRATELLSDCPTLYDPDDCQSAAAAISGETADYDAAIGTLESNLSLAQTDVMLLTEAHQNTTESLAKFLAFPLTPELQSGIFQPPDTILVKYQPTLSPVNYYYILLHELAHYYSHTPRGDLPGFLEEGITDYLAINVGQSTSLLAKIDGYPDEIQIAQALISLLGEEQVINLYFSKSIPAWTAQLDARYGSGCTKQLMVIGEQLTYTDLDNRTARNRLVTKALDLLTR